MSRDTNAGVKVFQDVQASETMLRARVSMFESAAIHAAPGIMETARSDAHSALDAWLDAVERFRRHLTDELRRNLR